MSRLSIFSFLPLLALGLALVSCSSATKVAYLQDMQPTVSLQLQEPRNITFLPGDRLSIVVSGRDEEMARMFNLNYPSTSGNSNTNSRVNLDYTVDADGYIDMPVLGEVKVGGMTRQEVAKEVKNMLVSQSLLRDPAVTVDYSNLGYSITGEVNAPGWQELDRDCITLLEAISRAGDLTIQGKRDNVLVMRTVDGIQTPYRVDLTDTKSLYSSPAFYLQQNDLIYVEPEAVKANEAKLNANTTRTPAFWISLASFVATIAVLLVK